MKPLELAHLFGRSHIIAEPWASTAELTAGLCSGKWDGLGCHEKIDRHIDEALLARVRWRAFWRLGLAYDMEVQVASEIHANHPDPIDAIRAALRLLELAGWMWDGKAIIKVGEVVQL